MSHRNGMDWFDELQKVMPEARDHRAHLEQLLPLQKKERLELIALRLELSEERLLTRRRNDVRQTTMDFVEKSIVYTNLIISIGFVGLFTAWTQSEKYLTPLSNRLVLTLAVLALAIFIAFEVKKMVFNSRMQYRLSEIAESDIKNFNLQRERYNEWVKGASPSHMRLWAISVGLTLGLSLASAGVLVATHLNRVYAPTYPSVGAKTVQPHAEVGPKAIGASSHPPATTVAKQPPSPHPAHPQKP